ncbi:MAG TPA: histidine phosphatase family protein [Stellaceae bacterium]|nr:histidine phosphatase family protein [Stellaceae bacterium]
MRLSLRCCLPTVSQRTGRFPLDEPAELTTNQVGPTDRFDWLRTAPELRARQTALLLGTATTDPLLRDFDLGKWGGSLIMDIHAGEAASWRREPEWAGHGGESVAELCHRVGAWLDAYHEPGHTIAVTHGPVIRAAVLHVLGAGPEGFWNLDVEPLGTADLRWTGQAWRLRSLG